MDKLFLEWWEYYFANKSETEKALAHAAWQGKQHLDFMRSEDDEPTWKKAVDRKKEIEAATV